MDTKLLFTVIQKIQKLTLYNYFQATQGTGRQVTEGKKRVKTANFK